MINSKIIPFITILFILLVTIKLFAQNDVYNSIDISGFDDDIRHWKNGSGKGLVYQRFDVDQITEIADNLLKFQNADGGWPKNIDWLGKLEYEEVWKRLSTFEKKSTCDNRNTYTQIEYLSKVYTETNEDKYRDGAVKGLNFILSTQNENGRSLQYLAGCHQTQNCYLVLSGYKSRMVQRDKRSFLS